VLLDFLLIFPDCGYTVRMSMQSSQSIVTSIDQNMKEMKKLYVASRLLRAELDVIEGRTTLHTSVKSLMHELEP